MRESQLHRALDQVCPPSRRAAALFLALPRDVAPTIAVSAHQRRIWYRGQYVELSADVVGDALKLATLGTRAGDQDLDLDAAPWTWVKVVPSGERRIVFGLDVLWDGPLVFLCAGVPETCAQYLAQHWLETGILPAHVKVGEERYAVTRSAAGYTVGEDTPFSLNTSTNVQEAAEAVAGELAGRLQDVQVLAPREGQESLEIRVDLDNGWTAFVPVLVGPTSEVVGAQAPARGVDHAPRVPGWEVLGARGPHVVGRHSVSGIVAYLLPT